MKKTGAGLLLLLVLAAAAWFLYDPDRNVIDEDLLKSQEFRSLNEERESAPVSIKDIDQELSRFIQKMSTGSEILESALAFRLDSSTISTYLTEINSFPVGNNKNLVPYFSAENFYRLGSLQFGGVSVLLFMVKQQGVYDDIDLYLATQNDSTLADMQMILEYRKNLTEYYSGEVSFEEGGGNTIRVVMQKKRRYPVEQSNTVSYRYVIQSDGGIITEVVSQ